jgi:DNA-binding transcriptional LysR family regulator
MVIMQPILGSHYQSDPGQIADCTIGSSDRLAGVDLRQLRYFLAVAEELHFTRAAQRLGIAQASLSEQVRRLEDEIGAPLLGRTSRQVMLTPAGQLVRDRARRVLADVDDTLRTARDVAAGRLGELRVGAVGAALTTTVPAVLRALRVQAPGLTVRVSQLSTTAQLDALADRRLDVGLVRGPAHHPGVHVEPLLRELLVAVLPHDHPLASRTDLDLPDLAGEPLVLWPRADGPGAYDHILALYQRANLSAPAVVEGPDTTTQLALIASGLGISLQPASFGSLGRRDLTLVPLRAPVPTAMLALAWVPPLDDVALRRFIDVARRHVGPVHPA